MMELKIVMGIVLAYLFWRIVLKPVVIQYVAHKAFEKKLCKRLAVLEEMGLKPHDIRDPHLTTWELEKMEDFKNLPTDEEILKYYKMYCKKWHLDNEDKWTTYEPMEFEEFEQKCKTPTKRVYPKEGEMFGFQVSGGYQYMIPKTCDAFIGFPPNQVIHRYNDYEKMVADDDAKIMETIEDGIAN